MPPLPHTGPHTVELHAPPPPSHGCIRLTTRGGSPPPDPPPPLPLFETDRLKIFFRTFGSRGFKLKKISPPLAGTKGGHRRRGGSGHPPPPFNPPPLFQGNFSAEASNKLLCDGSKNITMTIVSMTEHQSMRKDAQTSRQSRPDDRSFTYANAARTNT